MQRNLIIVILFALLIAIFAIQNDSPVYIKVFSWNYQVSLVIVVLGAVALGAIIMGLVASLSQLRYRREIRAIKKERTNLEKENQELTEKIEQLEIKLDDETDKTDENVQLSQEPFEGELPGTNT